MVESQITEELLDLRDARVNEQHWLYEVMVDLLNLKHVFHTTILNNFSRVDEEVLALVVLHEHELVRIGFMCLHLYVLFELEVRTELAAIFVTQTHLCSIEHLLRALMNLAIACVLAFEHRQVGLLLTSLIAVSSVSINFLVHGGHSQILKLVGRRIHELVAKHNDGLIFQIRIVICYGVLNLENLVAGDALRKFDDTWVSKRVVCRIELVSFVKLAHFVELLVDLACRQVVSQCDDHLLFALDLLALLVALVNEHY